MRAYLQSLHALRGVACLLVLLAHIGVWEASIGPNRPLLGIVEWFGYAAVDCFFVLSGFVICYTQWQKLGDPGQARAYFLARFWRVFPLYWCMLPFAILQVHLISGEAATTLTGNRTERWLSWFFIVPHESINPYLPTTWTLPYEIAFYIIFGLLLVFPKRYAVMLLLAWGMGSTLLELRGVQHPIGRAVAGAHVWEILLGCLLAGVVRKQWLVAGRSFIAFGIIWAVGWLIVRNPHTISAYLTADPWGRASTFGIAAGAIVYGLAVWELKRNGRVPRALILCGDASYSIYLAHIPACSAFFFLTLRHWPHTTLGHIAWVFAMLTVGIGGGFLAYYFVEKPIMNWRKSRSHISRSAVQRVQLEPA